MFARPTRFYSDVRFLLGVALVIGAVAGVWGVVHSARSTVSVLAADRVLVPGQPITASDLRTVEASLGADTDLYLLASAELPDLVAVRTVEAGEIVPLSAVSGQEESETTTVVIVVPSILPDAVARGRTVELWATDAATDDVAPRPHLLIADATVASVDADSGGAMTRGTAVELIVPRATVVEVLQAQAAGAVLAVVPAVSVR